MEPSENDNENEKSPDIDLLLSFEKLDRSSPELWSSQLMSDFNNLAAIINTPNKASSSTSGAANGNTNAAACSNAQTQQQQSAKWMSDLNKDDIELLNRLATMSKEELTKKVENLKDVALLLGIEESYQMTRGKLLNVLDGNN